MEIEYLLNDFYHSPTHINEWLLPKTTDQKRKFTPIKLREREAGRQGVRVEELQTHSDYKVHSESLHVNPQYRHTAMRGVQEFDQALSLFPMYEIFFHGAGVLTTLMQYGEWLDREVLDQMGELSLDRFFTVWKEVREELGRIRSTFSAEP